MFKFNFGSSEEQQEESSIKKVEKSDEKVKPKSCVEIKYNDTHLEYAAGDTEQITLSNGAIVPHVDLSVAEWRFRQEPDIAAIVKSNSDLIPNVYEGGLKLWECAVDLTEYISTLNIAFRGINVLEVGCGVGLPGLYAFSNGAEVCFQDYNESVLNAVTIPSAVLNLTKEDEDSDDEVDALPGCRFFAGDWSSFTDLLLSESGKDTEDKRFDLILTSETTYSPDNYQCLHDTLKNLLKPDGTVYLAAKSYYFGVGGNLRDFEKLLQTNDVFSYQKCKEITDGVSREILELKFKTNS